MKVLHRGSGKELRRRLVALSAVLILATALAPAGLSRAGTSPQADRDGYLVDVVVQQVDGADLAPLAAAMGGTNFRPLPIINGFAVRLAPRAVEALGRQAGVLTITPNVTLGALNDDWDHEDDWDED